MSSKNPKADLYDYMVTPFQEKIVSIIPLPYPVAWLILCQLIFFIDFLVVRFYEPAGGNLNLSFAISLLIWSEAVAVIWISKSLERFVPAFEMFVQKEKKDALEWYAEKLSHVFNVKRMLILGTVFGLGIILTTLSAGLWRQSIQGKISVCTLFFLLGLGGGAMFYCLIGVARLVVSIGTLRLSVSIYQHPATSIKAIGSLLLRVALVTMGVYCVGILVYIVIPQQKGFLGLLWVALFGLFVLAYFVFPQVEVHNIMSKAKHERIRKFAKHLEEGLEQVTTNPTSDDIKRLKELFDVQRELNSMSEWPFDTRTILIILSSIIVPLGIVLLNWFFKK